MELHKNPIHNEYKSHAQAINQRDIIKFQAWADSYVYFPYLVLAYLWKQKRMCVFF